MAGEDEKVPGAPSDAVTQTETPDQGDEPAPVGRGLPVGRYIVVDRIGRGGGGVVYRAYDPDLDRRVAVKLLGGANPQRLLREAHALARLSHPNVVPIFDVGTHQGTVFLAMELLEGETLRDWLRSRPRTTTEILDAFIQAGRGLIAAHAAGMIHRDFKPSNVMVSATGRVHVLDFGLARGLGEDTTAPESGQSPERVSPSVNQTITRTGALIGTPAYMSPEQVRGERLTPASDQFSFCLALYEALWNVHPAAGDSAEEIIMAIEAGELREPPRTHTGLRAVVMRGLAHDPRRRYRSMEELVDALVSRKGRARAVGGTLAVVGVVAAVAAALWLIPTDRDLCRNLDAPMTTVWNADARTRLRSAFANSGHPDGVVIADHVVRELDAYAAKWSATRTDACLATHERNEQSQPLLDRRMSCLQDLAHQVGVAVRIWEGATRQQVAEAPRVTELLQQLPRCGVAPLIGGPTPRPGLEDTRKLLSEADALFLMAENTKAGERADRAMAEAVAAKDVGLQAEAAFRQSKVAMNQDRDADAEKLVFDTIRLAAAARDDALVAQAMVRLVDIEGRRLGRYDEALRLGRVTRSLVERAGEDPTALADLLTNEGVAYQRLGRHEDSIQKLEEALKYRRGSSGDVQKLAHTLTTLGNTLQGADRLEEAKAAFLEAKRVLELGQGKYGSHFRSLENNLAIIAARQGHRTEAIEHWKRLIEQEVVGYGPTSLELVYPYVNILFAGWEEGLLDVAAAHAELAIALYRGHGQPDHPYLGLVRVGLAYISIDRGDAAGALAHIAEGERIQKLGTQEPTTEKAQLQVLRGDAHVLEGRYPEARAAYEEGLRIHAAAKSAEHWLAAPRFGLAQVAWGTGNQAEARRLLAEAKEILGRAGPDKDPIRRRVAAWSTAHRL